jgi:hypothetical protein
VADDLNPRQMWEIVNKLEALDKKLDRADARIEGVVQVLDGVGQQPGIRQQLRELRHAIEGNPPAMRGVVLEMAALIESQAKLRRDFEAFVDDQTRASAKREGAWGGARLLWGLLGGAVVVVISILSLLVAIYSATPVGGG